MCLAVYLAMDRPIPPIDEAEFSVRPLAAHEESVRRHLSRTHVSYLGSYTGCGCGFIGDDPDPGEMAARAHGIAALVAYLDAQMPEIDFELFTCWEGDQVKAPQHRLRLTRSELPERTDWSEELTLALVTRTA